MTTHAITSDDILGKTAVDPLGSLLGVVVKLHIDNEKKRMLGITIDQGFMKPDLFVGMEHVRHFGDDAVLLETVPYHLLKGKKVLSSEGELLGVVTKVVTVDAALQTLIIAKRAKGFKKEEIEIAASDVKETGQTIILRKKQQLP